jgi:MoxR-like ATPase
VSVWRDLSFWENPYSTDPIAGSELGVQLLVGRSRELASLRRQITSASSHPTLEGENGVGKSSLAAVKKHRTAVPAPEEPHLRHGWHDGRGSR